MGWEWDDSERKKAMRRAEMWMTPEQLGRKQREDRLVNLFLFCVFAVAVAYLVFVAT